MNKTYILLFAFLFLGGLSLWFVNKPDETKSTMSNVEDRRFAVPDIENVGKIFIADRQGGSNTFVKKGKDWILNGKYKTRSRAINSLLTTIKKVELAFIPTKAAIPNIVEVLASHGVKVEVFDLEGKIIRTYYVGGLTNNEEATYMIMEGAEQPYAMKLSTMLGGLRARYVQEEKEWRDRDLFGLEVDEIDYVSLEYPKQKNKSFILERISGNDFKVKPFYDVTTIVNRPIKKGMPEAYLVGFDYFEAEGIINEDKARDSISQMVPFAIMTVKDNKGNTQQAAYHPLRRVDLSGKTATDEEIFAKSQIERYHVDHSKGDYYLIQQRNIGRAFWAYETFFEK